jgi:O-antigen/teichoic acid export membrane protein
MSAAAGFLRTAIASAEARVVMWTGALAACASLFALLTARWLGATDRGILVVFLTVSSFLMLVGSLGVGTGGRVLLNREPPLSLARYLRHSRLLSAVHVVTAATIGLMVLHLSNGLPSAWIAFFFVPYATAVLLSYLAREALHGLGRHEAALISDVLPVAVQVIAVLALHATGHLNLLGALVAIAAGGGVQLTFLLWRLSRVGSEATRSAWPLAKVVRFSLPAMVTALGQALVIRGDRLILGAFAGAASVGVYGVAATFTEMIWLIPSAVAQVAFRRASISNGVEAGRKVRRLTMALTFLLAGVLAITSSRLIDVLLGQQYASAVPLTYILLAAALPMASYQLDVAVLNGLGRLSASSRITLLGSVTLVVGCLATVPMWGPYGAAWSSLVAYSLMAGIAKYYLRRHDSDVTADAQERVAKA